MPKQPLAVPVLPGMREDLSPHLAPPGTLITAKNVRFPVSGEAWARRGTVALPVSTDADVSYDDLISGQGPDFLQPCPGGFVFGVAGYGFRYDFEQGRVHVAGSYANGLPYRRFATIATEEASLVAPEAVPWPLSVATGGGYVAVCWSGGNGAQSVGGYDVVKVHIYTEDGARVTTIERGDYSTGFVVWDAVSAAFILVAQQTSAGTVTSVDAAAITVNATGATLGAFTTGLGSLDSAACTWAVCPWPGIGWALVALSASGNFSVRKMLGTSTVASVTVTTGAGTTKPLSVYCDATNIYVGWVEIAANSTAYARVYNTSLALTSGSTITILADTGGASLTLTPPLFGTCVTAGSAFLVLGRSTSLTGDNGISTYMRAFFLTATGTLTSVNQIGAYHMFPVSSPFNNGMVWCRYRTPNHSVVGNNYTRHVLVDFMAARQSTSDAFWKLRWPRVALACDPFADPAGGNYRGGAAFLHACAPVQLANGRWVGGIPRLVRAESVTGTGSGLALGEWLEYSANAGRDSLCIAGETIVAGSPALVSGSGVHGTRVYAQASLGLPSTANQNQGIDIGFFVEPSIDQGAQSNTAAGALTASGTYQYRTVIEWIDGQGRRWRSRASRVQTIGPLGAGNDTVTFTTADDMAWLRQDSGLIFGVSGIVKHYYRTTDAGSQFYRCTPPQGAPLAGAGSVFVDTLGDTDLATREVLYTDGGVLDNDHAPSCQFLATTEDRVWCGGLWDRKQLQSSKLVVPGEPFQFSDSPAFRVVLPEDNTGLASQDGTLIAFARSSIHAVVGGGPTDQGQGAWDSPRVVTRSTGAVNGRSILETSAGVFFQSDRGIELLPRGLGEPQFIGAPIQTSLDVATTPVLSAAVISSDESRTARFCVGTPQVFVVDLDTGAWSIDEYPMNVSAICDTDEGAVIAMSDVTGSYGFLLESATATQDSEGNGPQDIACELEWSALRPFTIAGWGRFNSAVGVFDELPIGYSAGNCTMFVQIDNAADTGATFAMAGMASPDYREHVPAQMNGTALRLKLTTEVGGWRFMGWTVAADGEPGGVRRVAAEERA